MFSRAICRYYQKKYMEFQKEEKLPLNIILIISGISCMLFTLLMYLLDGVLMMRFFQIGAGCLITGLFLFLLKKLFGHVPVRKRTENSPH